MKKSILNDYTLNNYAIIATGGKQYIALEGKTLEIEKIDGEIGTEVVFNEVLLRKSGEDKYEVGSPFLSKPAKAVIVKQVKGPKLIVFKFKRRKKYRRKKGHRQVHTVVRFTQI